MSSNIKFKYFLYILLAAYVIYLAISIYQMRAMMNYSDEYLIHVREDTRDIRSRVNELQNIVPPLLSNGELNYPQTEAEFKRQEGIRDQILASLEKYYQGDSANMDNLKAAFAEMRKQLRKVAARMETNTDYEKAVLSYDLEIMPYIRQILAQLNEVDISSTSMMKNIQAKIINRMNLTFILSIIFGIIIIFFFIIADQREKAKNKELAYKDTLFNQLSENVDEVFIMAASADKFIYTSSNCKRLLNIGAKALLDKPEDLYSLLDNPEIVKWLKNILNGIAIDESSWDEEVEIASLQKSFKIRVYPISNSNDKEKRFLISLSDQTQAIKHQEALSVALENAHAASAAKSSFLSHMSHEIRTPMNAIIGMTTIAISRLNDQARVKDCLGKISESSRHLLGLINDVLDMSKIESGKFSINHENFNLHQCIGNINNIVQPQARNRQLQFDIFLDKVEEEELIGDSLRLNQVLLNLLSNAYKFTPPGGKIALRIQQLQVNKNTARFRFIVSDTGIGMSEEYLKKLYSPFEQASASTASKYGGTGLGMPITSNIISLMGGTIQVESKEGEGTKFTVELPFGLSGQNSAKNYNLPQLKVLVVDDDPGTCEHATLLLNKMGLKTRWTLTGEEAVRLAAEAHDAGDGFDVCLIDWKMPDMDGAETARKIRDVVGNDVLIIIISAYDWSPIEEEARKAGVNDFIAKPFFSSSLYDALLGATRRLTSESGSKKESSQYDFSGKRILLVEDNEFNREIGQEFLEMVHIEVDNAENGQEAVDKVINSPAGYYDLVLMDVQMPVMNGYDATRAIRSSAHPEANDLIILAMTANAFSEDVAKAVAAGMNGHLAKPIDVNELYRLLDAHLNKKKQSNAEN